MAKKYEYRRVYAVVWWNKHDWQTHWKYGMTYYEAVMFARKMEKTPDDVYWVEIVKRVHVFDGFGKECHF